MAPTGDDLKTEGMARALDAAANWREVAREAVEWLAASGRDFTSEDLTAIVGLPHPDATEANRNNAVGAVISGAARRGLIRRVGLSNANRAVSHAAALSVWRGTAHDHGPAGRTGA